MSTLLDILTQFPNCRVTIGGPTRRKPHVGDRRYRKRTGWQIRRRSTYQGMQMSRNGRPVYEWVPELTFTEEEMRHLKNVGEMNGAKTL